jgi:hypothetical protein
MVGNNTVGTYGTIETCNGLEVVFDEFGFLSNSGEVGFVNANKAIKAARIQEAGG